MRSILRLLRSCSARFCARFALPSCSAVVKTPIDADHLERERRASALLAEPVGRDRVLLGDLRLRLTGRAGVDETEQQKRHREHRDDDDQDEEQREAVAKAHLF